MDTFFHLDRGGVLHAGQELDLVPLASLEPIPDSRLQEHVEQIFPEGLTWHGLGYFFFQNAVAFPVEVEGLNQDQLSDMRSRAIELVFEYIRRAHFPERPSRYQTVFAWRMLDDARRFAERPGISSAETVLWTVEGEEVFRADMELLRCRTALETSWTAHRYWKGEPADDGIEPHWESFLAPPVRVVERHA